MKKTVLSVGAHPDDIEIGCGGTLALLRDQGYELIYLIVTSGEEGTQSSAKSHVAKIREEEAYRAALILGASQVLFLREADGLTFFSKKTKIRLISILRELRPEIVFTHAKSDHFPDHQIVHQLTLSAIVAASGPWYSDAPQTPHRVSKIYGYEVWNPIPQYQLAVDITATLSRKLEALRAHTSQIGNVDYLGAATGLAKYRGVSSMSGDYAEVFEILQDTLL